MLRCKLVWRSFCYYKICVNSFQIIRSIIFSAVKKVSLPHSRTFFLLNDFFHSRGMFFYNQEIFLQSTNFSTVKKFFHSRGNFQQSRNSSTVTEFFQNQGIFWHLKQAHSYPYIFIVYSFWSHIPWFYYWKFFE